MKKIASIFVFICLSGVTLFTNITLAQQYQVIDLKTLGGTMSKANSLNDNGQIVGTSSTSSGQERAFLYENNLMKSLGTLGGSSSYAVEINNAGQITGRSREVSGRVKTFLYQNGVMSNLGTLNDRESRGTGINNLGIVVGTLMGMPGGGPPYRTGVIFENGNITPVGYSNEINFTNGINDSGLILGLQDFEGDFGSGSTYGRRTFLYHHGNIIDWNLAGYQGQYLVSGDLNNKGSITGYISPDIAKVDFHAFAYIDHELKDLGTLKGGAYSYGRGINEAEQIVGQSQGSSGDARAFIWNSRSGMVDLNSLIDPNAGWRLKEACDINNHGEIVGFGEISGENHAFLLKPMTSLLNLTHNPL